MARAFSSVPIVNVSGLRSRDAGVRRGAAAALGEAARDVGFLYIEGHGIPEQALRDLQATARRYFAQPLDAKMASYIGRSVNHSGYSPEGEETNASGVVGLKESYDVGVEIAGPPLAPMLGPNQWPNDPDFRRDVGSYYEQVAELARLLFRGFALALNLPEDRFEGWLWRRFRHEAWSGARHRGRRRSGHESGRSLRHDDRRSLRYDDRRILRRDDRSSLRHVDPHTLRNGDRLRRRHVDRRSFRNCDRFRLRHADRTGIHRRRIAKGRLG